MTLTSLIFLVPNHSRKIEHKRCRILIVAHSQTVFRPLKSFIKNFFYLLSNALLLNSTHIYTIKRDTLILFNLYLKVCQHNLLVYDRHFLISDLKFKTFSLCFFKSENILLALYSQHSVIFSLAHNTILFHSNLIIIIS